MMEDFGEIMTQKVSARYLKIRKSDLCQMAREVKIPVVKIEFGRDNLVV